MANSIIHFPLFGLVFSLFESDLGLRVRIAGSLSRVLPSSGAVSLPRGISSSGAAPLSRALPSSGAASLPGGLPSFGAASLPGNYRLSVRHRYRGITVFRCGIATGGITVFRSRMLPLTARTLANSEVAFEGATVFRCGIATGGIAVFRSRTLPLNPRRRRDCLKLMLSAVWCDKFLTLWDLVSSVFEVSFWAKAFQP